MHSPHELEEILLKVEWETLLFFAALFVMVESLSELGMIRMLAQMLADWVSSVEIANRQVYILFIGDYLRIPAVNSFSNPCCSSCSKPPGRRHHPAAVGRRDHLRLR